MSTDALKRRGRPKKTSTEEVVVVAEEPAIPVKRPRASRKSTRNGEETIVPATRPPAPPSDNSPEKAVSEKKKATKATTTRKLSTTKSAKEAIGEAQARAQAPQSTSAIVEQADAFGRATKGREPGIRNSEAPQELSPTRVPSQKHQEVKSTPRMPQDPVLNPSADDQSFDLGLGVKDNSEDTNAAVNSEQAEFPQVEAFVPIREESENSELQVLPENPESELEPISSESIIRELNGSHQPPLKSKAIPAVSDTSEVFPELTTSQIPTQTGIPIFKSLTMPAPQKAASQSISSPTNTNPQTNSIHPSWTAKPRALPTRATAVPAPLPQPKPPKLTELPYDALRKVPEYRAASRKITSIMVAIPIALVTSYVLYERFKTSTPPRKPRSPLPQNGGI